jgi:surface antigen
MKQLLLAAIVAMAASGPAWAQSTSATSVGRSASQAISGQGGSAKIISNNTAPADQTLKNVPTTFAPGLTAAGLETCLGSVSGGASFVGTGVSFGSTIRDAGCAARLDARTLWSMGLKKAAVARLCLEGDIYRAMPKICNQYLPPSALGYAAAPPVPTRYAQAEASEEQPYTGGDIWLAEGATGNVRLCHDYDVTQQRCRVWAHTWALVEVAAGKHRLCHDYDVTQQRCRVWAHTVHHSAPKPKKEATASGGTSHTAPSPARHLSWRKPKEEKSHEAADPIITLAFSKVSIAWETPNEESVHFTR